LNVEVQRVLNKAFLATFKKQVPEFTWMGRDENNTWLIQGRCILALNPKPFGYEVGVLVMDTYP